MAEVKWKSPYKTKIREETALNASRTLAIFHNLYLYRLFTKLTTPKLKTPLEFELSKFVAIEPRRSYFKRWFVAGIAIGAVLYIYDTKARQINAEVVDPGRFFMYNYKLYTVARELRFKGWGLLQFHAGILFKNPRVGGASADSFILEPFKRDYMLALQVDHYEKHRDKKFDFLGIGEQTIYQLI